MFSKRYDLFRNIEKMFKSNISITFVKCNVPFEEIKTFLEHFKNIQK